MRRWEAGKQGGRERVGKVRMCVCKTLWHVSKSLRARVYLRVGVYVCQFMIRSGY